MPALMRDVWGPSFDAAEQVISEIWDKFEWALRERAIYSQIVPYGQNYSLNTALQVAFMNPYDYDPRADSCYEEEDFEPLEQ